MHTKDVMWHMLGCCNRCTCWCLREELALQFMQDLSMRRKRVIIEFHIGKSIYIYACVRERERERERDFDFISKAGSLKQFSKEQCMKGRAVRS